MAALKSKKKKERQKFDKYITYHDIFALALALTSIKVFSSDSMDWHRAFYEICQKYGKSIPEISHIFFDHSRPPLPPMAEEVYDLQTLLMMSKELEGLGLAPHHILRIPDGVRPKIIKEEEKRLAKYMKQIRDMAKIFSKHLKTESG